MSLLFVYSNSLAAVAIPFTVVLTRLLAPLPDIDKIPSAKFALCVPRMRVTIVSAVCPSTIPFLISSNTLTSLPSAQPATQSFSTFPCSGFVVTTAESIALGGVTTSTAIGNASVISFT